MINDAVMTALRQKMADGEFSTADIPAFLDLFCALGNTIEDSQETVAQWDRRIYLELDGLGDFWIQIEHGRFTKGTGAIKNPQLILTMNAVDAALIFSGAKDAQTAFMAGEIKVDGDLPDALKMQTLIDLVIEEIEY